MPLNYRLTPEEACYVINHSDAEVAYVDYEHAPMFAALRGQLEKVRHIIAVGGPAPGRDADRRRHRGRAGQRARRRGRRRRAAR